MLIIGLILILFAIWMNIGTETLLLKPIGFIVGIIGGYIILKYRNNNRSL